MDRTLLAPDTLSYLPINWETVGATLGWIAFGSSLPTYHWNQALYLGAADGLDPAEAFQRLYCIALGDDHPACPAGPIPSGWMPRLRTLAEWLRAKQLGAATAHTHTDEAARAAAAWLVENVDDGRSERIWDELEWAAEDLRRALARDALPAFGWPGGSRPEGPLKAPRRRVPAEVFAAPVSLTPDGLLLPFPVGDDVVPGEFEPLFSGILLPVEGILATWPAPPEDEDPARAPPVSVPAAKRTSAPTGRPPHKAKDACAREMVRLALDPDGLPDPSQLLPQMKEWAALNYATDVPGDTTVEDWIALFDPRRPMPTKRERKR
jgi:hypothetical protein